MNFFQKPRRLLGINILNFLKQPEVVAQLLCNVDKGADVFRKTRTTVTKPGIEKRPANAFVQTHTGNDIGNIRATGFADDGKRVGVGNFQSEK